MFRPRPSAIAAFILPFAVAMALPASAQQVHPTDPTDHNTSADDSPLPMTLQQSDPTQRKLTDKEKIAQQRALREEEKGAYKTWLNEDVRWIITDEEEKAFKSLTNDEERDNFIENFWLRRNPNPDSPDNEFRDEHYRRIQYANDHFAAGKPGW